MNTVFANISKTILPTSDSFLLIMSHIVSHMLCHGLLNTYTVLVFLIRRALAFEDDFGNEAEPFFEDAAEMASPDIGVNKEAQTLTLMERRKLRKAEKKKTKPKKDKTCWAEGMNCFEHDNEHWRTAPFWSCE